MRTLLMIPIVALSLIFELVGRLLHQVSLMAMEIARLMLSAISTKD